MKERFYFFLVLVFIAALFVIAQPKRGFSAYDAAQPANDLKIASGPAVIRENFRALKDDAEVNAGRLASYTYVEVMGDFFTCIASTTSTEMLNASGGKLLLGSAIGVYSVRVVGHGIGDALNEYRGRGIDKTYFVRVATTTEIMGSTPGQGGNFWSDTTSQLWDIGIATSATPGELTMTATGPVGPYWNARTYTDGAHW